MRWFSAPNTASVATETWLSNAKYKRWGQKWSLKACRVHVLQLSIPLFASTSKYASPETNFVRSEERTKINYQRRITFVLRPLASRSDPKIIRHYHVHRNTLFTSFLIDFSLRKREKKMTTCLLTGRKRLCFTDISVWICGASLLQFLQTKLSSLVSLKDKWTRTEDNHAACYKTIFLFY